MCFLIIQFRLNFNQKITRIRSYEINLVQLIIPFFVTFLAHAQKTLTLATTHCCPYTFDFNGSKHGIVGEIMTSILHAQGINLNIEYYR
jgi:hypothetical protein